ncbi:cardiolipin synthetase [Thraustotheca clavata]|uniref:Cardiolipin synthetase n=1 Tax=Thraustotheca clavata TaxID=74557 RepID=A0A1V9YRT6_9STRA|nr:cardiolipin synthetase [Thraustotheca clavata]
MLIARQTTTLKHGLLLLKVSCRQSTKINNALVSRLVHSASSNEKSNNPHDVVNLPNAITFTRIVSTPYLGYLIATGNYPTALGVLGVAGFSDWLDGYLARKLNQKTIVGTFLDPLADKLMVGTLCVSMAYTGLLPLPVMVIIFGRDLLLVGGTFYHRYHTKTSGSGFFQTDDLTSFEVTPSLLSKVNTALQFGTLGSALLNATFQFPGELAMNVLFGSVAISTFASGSMYLRDYLTNSGTFHRVKK